MNPLRWSVPNWSTPNPKLSKRSSCQGDGVAKELTTRGWALHDVVALNGVLVTTINLCVNMRPICSWGNIDMDTKM